LALTGTADRPGIFLMRIHVAIFAAGTLLSPVAHAACAGFGDIEASSPFCNNVQWIRNRAITSGCVADGSAYCPDQPVSRLHMAAFLSRLGHALTPVQLTVDVDSGAINLDVPGNVVCQTADYPVSGFPRTAYVDLTMSVSGPADVSFAADLVRTTDGGATWHALTTLTNRASVAADSWASLANIAEAELDVGQTVRFGVRISRDGIPGTAHLSQSRCQLRAVIHSRTGAAPPF
jgi:hypothetical protein